jgi:hypothetical protein
LLGSIFGARPWRSPGTQSLNLTQTNLATVATL